MEVVDLCTPPASPVRHGAENLNAHPAGRALGKRKADEPPTVIDLLSSSDEDTDGPSGGAGSSTDAGRGTGRSSADVCEIAAPPRTVAAEPTGGDNDDDDDLAFVGRTGALALADFPHARENCVAHPWSKGPAAVKACPNCYCYVCDAPGSGCPNWREHCEATHTEQRWRQARNQWKATSRGAGPSAAGSSSGPAPARSSGPSVGPSCERMSCEAVLKAVERVYPVETPEPAGFAPGFQLRPYQKQSLAFMLDIERGTVRDVCRPLHPPPPSPHSTRAC